ncbi:hypothetical protein As57867_005362, partial [Aphanomyces stellatus]
MSTVGACLTALGLYARQLHGLITSSDVEAFFSRNKASKKYRAVVDAHDGIESFLSLHGAAAKPFALAYVDECIIFAQTDAALRALEDAAVSSSLPLVLGVFRKKHPQFGFLWSNSAIVSCGKFIEMHGKRATGTLEWDT